MQRAGQGIITLEGAVHFDLYIYKIYKDYILYI